MLGRAKGTLPRQDGESLFPFHWTFINCFVSPGASGEEGVRARDEEN